VDEKPRDFNFGEGFGETWEIVFPQNATDEERDDYDKFTPMMNYIYPLPRLARPDKAAQQMIRDTACVVVRIREGGEWQTFLALAGGGMDLSWDICEAYMLLGYLPPAHFAADLPAYAGMTLGGKTSWILAGCRRSLQVVKRQAGYGLRHLSELRRRLK
jgi:hypothetical protein